jgi:hypothetical protein
MGSSTSGGSSGGVSRQPATIKPKAGTKPGEEGRYTIPSGPSGATLATTTMDPDKLQAKRQERAASISERGGGIKAEKTYERESSISELTGRLDRTLPGIAGGLGRVSLERQIAALEKGATPVKIETPSGDFLTVGTITEKGDYTGRAEYAEIAREAQKSGTMAPFIETTQRAAEERAAALREVEEEPEPTIITPETTPEVTPEADAVMLGETTRGRRRTKRPGAGGTLLEGGGVLYD